MTILLEGRAASTAIRKWVASSVIELKKKHKWTPTLITVQVGENAASKRYIKNQIKACHEAGINARIEKFPDDIKKEDFLEEIRSFAHDKEVDGIIVQTPFPKSWNMNEIVSAIPPEKDVEGVHPENLGRLYLGEKDIPFPCTAWSALSLLEWYGRESFEGKQCVVIGRSANVGRAIAIMLMHKNATVTICHTKTSLKQMKDALASADVVVVAAGVAEIVNLKDLSTNAWVIDVGTNFTAEGKLVGDVASNNEKAVAALSPVPGGVGPITVSLLLVNLLLCATRRRLEQSIQLPSLFELHKKQ